MISAALLLALASGARGEIPQEAEIDRTPEGIPYVAGELLVAYESGTSKEEKENLVGDFAAKTLDTIPDEETRLVSFPEIKEERSEEERGKTLQEKLKELEQDPRVAAVDYNYVFTYLYTPNDPQFGRQWGLRRAGFREAWNTTRGRRGIKIAVVDSGVAARHPDIGKIAAQRDFVEENRVADDEIGHGTHVAGIAAAVTNNRRGIAGGCPQCRLVVAKVGNRRGATLADLVQGIRWSVNRGAKVINISLGSHAKSKLLGRVVTRAWKRGAVIVAAAGNKRTSRRVYPAAYSKAIAVVATTRGDGRAKFSNRGKWVDLAAPGVDILSTFPRRTYRVFSGTSMSAPHVSALAGLLASQGLPADQIRDRMQRTAKDLGPRGRDRFYGSGRIDAAKAVR